LKDIAPVLPSSLRLKNYTAKLHFLHINQHKKTAALLPEL
jgi:hypothetical protein